MDDRTGKPGPNLRIGVVYLLGILLAVTATACSSTPQPKGPSMPLITGEPQWPEEVTREASRADRICTQRQAALRFEQEQAKKEQEKFKTIMGSITGGIGTVGGGITGVGAYVIDSPDTMKTVSGITGIVTAGLGAVGSLVTLFVKPGDAKVKSTSESLLAIEQKKDAARTALTQKDPSTWSEEEKAAWAKAEKDLEDACK